MQIIHCKTKGKNLNGFFEKTREIFNIGVLDKYGKEGVKALQQRTPKDSGKTAESWYYKIEHTKYGATLTFMNSNIQNGYNVAIVLQTGHATRNGSWVEGIDYINPALEPIFKELADNAFKEATKK